MAPLRFARPAPTTRRAALDTAVLAQPPLLSRPSPRRHRYKREVAPKDETLAVADIFRALSVEPPAMCRGRGTTEINVRQSQHSNENL